VREVEGLEVVDDMVSVVETEAELKCAVEDGRRAVAPVQCTLGRRSIRRRKPCSLTCTRHYGVLSELLFVAVDRGVKIVESGFAS
jgi:hypothetical protein